MGNNQENENERITRQSKDILNKHGYSFQYSVIKNLLEITNLWKFYGAEIPVSTRSRNTHIDFVFQDFSTKSYMVAECKRVNPMFADWVFIKTPYNSRSNVNEYQIVLEKLREFRGKELPSAFVGKELHSHLRHIKQDICGVGFKVKKHLKNNEVECQESIYVINNCVEQVLLSTSGFINYLAKVIKPSNFVNYDFSYFFIPVVITTAKLWVTESNIAEADLENGNLNNLEIVREVPYVWYNYNRPHTLSPELKKFSYHYDNLEITQTPPIEGIKISDDFGKYGFEFMDFTRSVLIVNSSNLDKLDKFNDSYFGF